MKATFNKAVESLYKNKGFTFSVKKQELNPLFGFSVAVDKENEQILPAFIRYKKDSVEAKIKEYINSHLSYLNKDSFYLGGWIDGGKLYLDVVEIVSDKKTAETKAIERHQEAIFDNLSKQTIYIN